MRRVLALLLLAASAAVGQWVWAEWERPVQAGDAPAPGATRALPAVAVKPASDDSQRRRDELAMILARPVFSQTRRPKEEPGQPAPAAAAPAAGLPRMSAILINGETRSAIFDSNGKTTVLSEGGRLGAFTIQSIEPQKVTLIGPDGKRVVRTAFSNEAPPAPGPAGFPALMPPGLPPPPSAIVLPPGTPTFGAQPGFPVLGTSR